MIILSLYNLLLQLYDAAVAKARTFGIAGARNLTSNEYTEMLRADREKRKTQKH